MNRYPMNAKPHGGNRGVHRKGHERRHWNCAHSNPADVQVLLCRLDGVKPAGKGWRARCPAHGGHSESLSIAASDTGRVLVRCHAQCTAAAIVEAVGLRLADLCPMRERGRPDPLAQARAAAIVASAKRRREAEELQRHQSAAAMAARQWSAASQPDARHAYLRAKGVTGHGIREAGGRLLVPLRDGTGMLWNLQSIGARGDKLFLSGGRKRGLWHLLGGPVSGVLCVAEGFATAASVHEATGHPVAVAFDAGNLEPVARALRDLYPATRIIVCADDDADTAARIGRNPGMDAANAAARAVGGSVARPIFGGAA